MARASYVIELATGDGAFPSTWVNITDYVKDISIKRGRDDVLSVVQPGTASITLDNRDGRFSPAYQLSPLYPNVSLMRAVRIYGKPGVLSAMTFAEIAAYTFAELSVMATSGGLFYGYIQSITPRPRLGEDECTIELTDGFTWLDLATVTPTFSSGSMSQHATAVLNSAGWPASARALSTGVLTFTPSYTDQSALSALSGIINENEGGLLYMDGGGNVVAQDQNTRFSWPYTSSIFTITDTDHIIDLAAERPISDVANEIKVTYSSGSVTKTDAASQAKYGPRRLNVSASFLGGTEADDWATWLLLQRKEPKERITVTMLANSSSTLIIQAMARDLSDRIYFQETVTKTGTGNASATPPSSTEGEYYIEGISHSIGNGGATHVVEWQLSPVVPYSRTSVRNWWTLGTSQLESSPATGYAQQTRLSY